MTEEEREIEAKFLEETQKARAQMQLIQMAHQEKFQTDQENARIAAEAEFEKWYASVSDDELVQLVPPTNLSPLRSEYHKISVRAYFKRNFGVGE
jgi:hypothetical protein